MNCDKGTFELEVFCDYGVERTANMRKIQKYRDEKKMMQLENEKKDNRKVIQELRKEEKKLFHKVRRSQLEKKRKKWR